MTVSTLLTTETTRYDFLKEIDYANRRREDIDHLYGDRNFYWIFNDKGNVHSESQGEPIGMKSVRRPSRFRRTTRSAT